MSAAVDFVMWYAHNFYHNLTHMFDGMNTTRWLRLIAVIGAYLLFRPYVVKFMAKEQTSQFENQTAEEKAAREKAELEEKEGRKRAKLMPNDIRGGQVEIPDSDDESDGGDAGNPGTGADWGKKATKRSRKVLKQILEEQEKRLEEDDNEDIKEFMESDILVDYEEGKDGW